MEYHRANVIERWANGWIISCRTWSLVFVAWVSLATYQLIAKCHCHLASNVDWFICRGVTSENEHRQKFSLLIFDQGTTEDVLALELLQWYLGVRMTDLQLLQPFPFCKKLPRPYSFDADLLQIYQISLLSYLDKCSIIVMHSNTNLTSEIQLFHPCLNQSCDGFRFWPNPNCISMSRLLVREQVIGESVLPMTFCIILVIIKNQLWVVISLIDFLQIFYNLDILGIVHSHWDTNIAMILEQFGQRHILLWRTGL